MKNKQKWYDYLWVLSALYLVLGFFNIMFAWLGMICFITPLALSLIKGDKSYCNRYCGRGQLLNKLGSKWSMKRDCPAWLRSKWFRYGFLLFFLSMFMNMLYMTYLVFQDVTSLKMVVTLFWTFKLPWEFAYFGGSAWINQFAFGFYSIMLTSTLLGVITMILFKPRTWCVYCPMGTMTQMICQIKKH